MSTGRKIEKFTSWEVANKSKTNGISLKSEFSMNDWFFIQEDEYIWWLNTDTSDSGCFNSEGPLVIGYKAKHTDNTKLKLDKLLSAEKKQQSKKSSEYMQARMK